MSTKDWWVDGHFISAPTAADALAEVKAMYSHDAEHVRPWTQADQDNLDDGRVEIIMERHITERRHSTWTAIIPTSWLQGDTFFNEDREPTPAFDRWMVDHGEESDVEFTSDGRADPDDHEFDDLSYDIVAITDINPSLEGTDQ